MRSIARADPGPEQGLGSSRMWHSLAGDVDDATLRGQLEETLIKFLKSNAVINQRLVDR